MRHRYRVAAVASALAISAGAFAVSVPTKTWTRPEGQKAELARAPLRLAEAVSLDAKVRLSPASVGAADQLAALRSWNAAGKKPTRVSIHRDLIVPLSISIDRRTWADAAGAADLAGGWVAASPGGGLVWATSVEAEGAKRMRIQLVDVDLPTGTRLWVYGADGLERPFGLKYLSEKKTLWTPSVSGSRIHLEVELPAGASEAAARFSIQRIADFQVGLVGDGPQGGLVGQASPEDCLIDGSCVDNGDFSAYSSARHGVLEYFIDPDGNGFGSTCSAGVLNNVAADFTPFILTANHCLSVQSDANSFDPAYNYMFVGCPWTDADLELGPIGATILHTEEIGGPDVTLLLAEDPLPFVSNLTFLGWNAGAIGDGTHLYRLSHPVACLSGEPCASDDDQFILPQMFSETMNDNTPDLLCEDGDGNVEPDELPFVNFLYQDQVQGTTVGGSSGSVVMLDNGQVVGQLFGACVNENFDSCNYSTFEATDGRFSSSFAAIGPYLTGASGCIPGPTVACLLANRFQVEVEWTDFSFVTHDAFVSPQSTSDSAIFYFLDSDNLEFLVKMLNACTLNSRFWVFAGGATNVGYTITVTDTQNAAVRSYFNPLGNPAPAVTDTDAFATCP